MRGLGAPGGQVKIILSDIEQLEERLMQVDDGYNSKSVEYAVSELERVKKRMAELDSVQAVMFYQENILCSHAVMSILENLKIVKYGDINGYL